MELLAVSPHLLGQIVAFSNSDNCQEVQQDANYQYYHAFEFGYISLYNTNVLPPTSILLLFQCEVVLNGDTYPPTQESEIIA